MTYRHGSAPRPLAALGRGVLAGVAGTAAMTAYEELVARLQAGSDGGDAEQGQDPWESAPAPAKVGRRLSKDCSRRVSARAGCLF